MALQDQLGKMIGPLPLGAWVAVVGGGLAFALYYRNRSAATVDPTTLDNTSTDPGVGQGGIPAGYSYTGPADSTTTAPTITDNDSWGSAALQYLLQQNISGTLATSAISKYLAGESLTANEAAVIRLAMQGVGAPPSVPTTPTPPTTTPIPTPPTLVPTFRAVASRTPTGLWHTKQPVRGADRHGRAVGPARPIGFGIRVTQWGTINGVMYGRSQTFYYPQSALTQANPTVHKGGSKPVQHPKAPSKPKTRTVTVHAGDSLSLIAQRLKIKGGWRAIWNLNRNKIKNPDRIQPGWVLIVPNS